MILLFLVLLSLSGVAPVIPLPAVNSQVQVQVFHEPASGADVAIALYANPEDWLEKAAFHVSVPATASRTTAVFRDIPPGTYAAAVFLDTNRNSKLDRTILGFFKEPMGFSRDARIRFGPPKWEDAMFEVDEAGVVLEVNLR